MKREDSVRMVNSAGLRPTRPARTRSRVAVRTTHARSYDFAHPFVGTRNRPEQTQSHQQPQSRPQYPVHQSLPAVNPRQDIYGSFESSASQAQGYQGPPRFTREDEPIRFLPQYRPRPLQPPFHHLPSHVTGGVDNRFQKLEPVILGSPRAQKLSQLNDSGDDLVAVQIASADDSVHNRHVPRKLAGKTGRQRKFVPQRLRDKYRDTDPCFVNERDGSPSPFSTKPSWYRREDGSRTSHRHARIPSARAASSSIETHSSASNSEDFDSFPQSHNFHSSWEPNRLPIYPKSRS